MKYPSITKISMLIVIIVLLCTGWLYFHSTNSPASNIRNVLLISMDTTRADALSCYGFKYHTTPNIDAIAQEGVLFENNYSPISLTLPSHSTTMTGTIPPYHGVHDNTIYKLDDSNVTLAEILKDKGFATGAIVSTFILNSQFGLDQGFDYYNDEFEEELADANISQRRGEETSRLAGEWIEEHKDENMFLFLHYYDPHRPYSAPEPYYEMFLDPISPPKNGSLDHLQGLYAGELRYTDDCINQVVEKLKELGLYDSTLIVIAGDHGEMFYQHKETTHGYFIYQGNLKVPLIFKVPGLVTPRSVKKTVGLVDVTPTVCSLLGIKIPSHCQGRDISSYLFEDEPDDLERHIFCESLTPTKYEGNSLLGIVNDQYKYIQTTRPELYNVAEDYRESNNLVEEQPHLARVLQDRLKQVLEETANNSGADSTMELDDEAIKRLESLGYVAGDVDEDFSFDQSKDDPKDLIDYHLAKIAIKLQLLEKKYDLAKKSCKEMIALKPNLYEPYFNLAGIANVEEDYEASIKYLLQAIELEPEDIKLYYFLANVYFDTGKPEDAIKYYKKTLQVDPQFFPAHGDLGFVYYQQQNFEQSLFHLQESLRLRAKQPRILNKLGAVYSKQGKTDLAIESFNKSLEMVPEQPEAMSELAMVLFGEGEIQEALELWSGALELDPDHVYASNSLAWVKATSKDDSFYDPTAALTFARKACELTEYQKSDILDTMAMAQAANGDFAGAIETADKAIHLAISINDNAQVAILEKHMKLYKAQQALRE